MGKRRAIDAGPSGHIDTWLSGVAVSDAADSQQKAKSGLVGFRPHRDFTRPSEVELDEAVETIGKLSSSIPWLSPLLSQETFFDF